MLQQLCPSTQRAHENFVALFEEGLFRMDFVPRLRFVPPKQACADLHPPASQDASTKKKRLGLQLTESLANGFVNVCVVTRLADASKDATMQGRYGCSHRRPGRREGHVTGWDVLRVRETDHKVELG